jgi:hypothetical protein
VVSVYRVVALATAGGGLGRLGAGVTVRERGRRGS